MTVRHDEPAPPAERPLPLTAARSAGSAAAALESLTALARELFGVAEAGLSGADGVRPEGLGPGTPFCAAALRQDEPLVVLDSAADVRFALAASPGCFYAGAPLTLPGGLRAGTFYLSDPAPRGAFSAHERLLLHKVAAAAADVHRNAHVGPDPDTIPASAPASAPARSVRRSPGSRLSAAGCRSSSNAGRRK